MSRLSTVLSTTGFMVVLFLAAVPARAQVLSGPAGAVATGATTFRPLANMAADRANAKNFGAKGDGSTDDTAALAAAIAAANAAGACAYLPAGTYRFSQLSFAGCLLGDGQGRTVLKLLDGNTVNEPVILTGPSRLAGLAIDGNKAASSVGTILLFLQNAWDVHLEHVRVTGAKALSGWGQGILVQGGQNAANATADSFTDVTADHNDGDGLNIFSDDYLTIAGSRFIANGGNGIEANNGAVPSGISVTHLALAGVIADNNAQDGFYCGIFQAANGSLGIVPGPNPVCAQVTVSGSDFSRNGGYGLAWQGTYGTITGNTVDGNGTGTGGGGILCNATNSLIARNLVTNNTYWGVDCGGSQYLAISGNHILNNGGAGTGTGGGVGLNVSASQNDTVSGNLIANTGTAAGGGTGLTAGLNDSGNEGPFLTTLSGLVVAGNVVRLGAASTYGIVVTGDAPASLSDNSVALGASGAAANAYALYTSQASSNRNRILDQNGQAQVTVASASPLVVADAGDIFEVTGTTGFSSVKTTRDQANAGTLIGVHMTSVGSGVTAPASVSMSFSGGGCSVAPATHKPMVANNGSVVGPDPSQLNTGSGCTSAPACAVSGGGLSGASCTAVVAPTNETGRRITLLFDAAVTVSAGGNIHLAGGAGYTSTAGGSLTLQGVAGGQWREIARSP